MRRLRTLLVTLLAGLLVPVGASAHAVRYEFKSPLPLWTFFVAGALVVALSAPAAAVSVQLRHDWTSRDLYRYLRPLHLAAVGLIISSLLLVDGLAGGFFGSPVFTSNPLTLLIWVDFWVGLGIASALLGNLWDFASPLSFLARRLDAALGRRGAPVRPYPPRLGLWPAFVLLLAWSWAELIWTHGQHPRDLAILVVAYLIVQLAGAAVFGAEAWLSNAELFTVVARTFARFAPLELYVIHPREECPAARCEPDDDERIGCPACWLAADTSARRLRLRGYGAGIRREPALAAGGSAFVVGLLATVVYDGFRGTSPYMRFQDALDWGAGSINTIGTVTMILVVGGFTLAYICVCALAARRERGGVRAIVRRYTPTLIPIAAVYFVAHYFVYFVMLGQISLGNFADPFEHEWVADYPPWVAVPAPVVWGIEAALIVFGHVIAILEAHRLALHEHRRSRAAFLAQLPLASLMVAYTFTGLWVLGQAFAGA